MKTLQTLCGWRPGYEVMAVRVTGAHLKPYTLQDQRSSHQSERKAQEPHSKTVGGGLGTRLYRHIWVCNKLQEIHPLWKDLDDLIGAYVPDVCLSLLEALLSLFL